MQEKNKVTMTIGGAEYVVTAEEDTSYMLAIGEEVDAYITKIMETNSQISTTVAAVFAALEFCDRSKKAGVGADNLRAQIKGYVDEATRAHLEVGEAKREVDEARREINRLNQQIQVLKVKLARLGEVTE